MRRNIKDLEIAPFHVEEIFNDVEDQYFFFSTMYSNITNVPLKTRNVKPNPPPFMNSTYKKAIRTRLDFNIKKSASQIAKTGKISGYKEI